MGEETADVSTKSWERWLNAMGPYVRTCGPHRAKFGRLHCLFWQISRQTADDVGAHSTHGVLTNGPPATKKYTYCVTSSRPPPSYTKEKWGEVVLMEDLLVIRVTLNAFTIIYKKKIFFFIYVLFLFHEITIIRWFKTKYNLRWHEPYRLQQQNVHHNMIWRISSL